VGLSATLGDYRAALEWLSSPRAGGVRDAVLIREEKPPKRRLRLALDYFRADPEDRADEMDGKGLTAKSKIFNREVE
jgi:hypothetical protein